MNPSQSSRAIVKNVVVAITLGVAAVATWAVTQSNAPTIEAAASVVRNG
jgi:hypothetical protein